MEKIKLLHSIGVYIENHGWTHQEIKHLSKNDFICHIIDSTSWLKKELDINSRYYAVPFGETIPCHLPNSENYYDFCFLCSNEFTQGQVGKNVINRSNLNNKNFKLILNE